MSLQKRERVPRPRLVPEAVELGNEPDSTITAKRGQLTGVRLLQTRAITEFGMRLVVEPVVDLQNQDIDPHRLHCLVDRSFQQWEILSSRPHQVQCTPRPPVR